MYFFAENGRSLLFMKAGDYVRGNGLSVESMEEMLKMRLEDNIDEETRINAMNVQYGHELPFFPLWSIADEKAEVLGRYAVDRKPALARKAGNDYTVYFSGLGNMKEDVLRKIAKAAGVFLYTEKGEAMFVNEGLIGVYNTFGEQTRVHVPEDGV